MTAQRHVDRSRGPAHARDIGLWHLGSGLLVVGATLGATIGLPPFPRVPLVSMGGLAASSSAIASDLGHRGDQVSSEPASFTPALPAMPTLIDVELFFRSPSTTQLDAVGVIISWIAWLLWLWLLGTTVLRIVVVLGERTAGGARWPSRLRAFSDRVTLSLVRQAVDAALAGEMLLRAVAPAPAPVVPLRIEYAQIHWSGIAHTLDSPVVTAAQRIAMAPDLERGDVLYTVQPGDNLSRIAERFYGESAAFNQIVEANLAREQPRGQTLRDARFIYPGWQLVIPAPTQTIHTDPDGQRWYAVRAGDTLSGISARLLGDAERYTELFADNEGVELGDGHVLTNPNLIWPGLHLRLPAEPPPEEAAEPASPMRPAAPPGELGPASPAPVPSTQEKDGQAVSADDGNGADNSGYVNVEPAPTVVP